jgi:hypothetical protein
MADANLPEPKCIALVVCDNVYEDSTGKRALVGLFTRITAAHFPARHPKLCVVVSLTELRLQTTCKLDIVRGTDHEPIIEMNGALPADSPTMICDMVMEIRNVVFPEPGNYWIRFWGHGQILSQRPIEVVKMPKGDDDD